MGGGGGVVHDKPVYRGDCLKGGGARTVCRFKRGLGKKEGVSVFEKGGLTP